MCGNALLPFPVFAFLASPDVGKVLSGYYIYRYAVCDVTDIFRKWLLFHWFYCPGMQKVDTWDLGRVSPLPVFDFLKCGWNFRLNLVLWFIIKVSSEFSFGPYHSYFICRFCQNRLIVQEVYVWREMQTYILLGSTTSAWKRFQYRVCLLKSIRYEIICL